jgi:1-acyl-sn-glycerol-3-phosphate acyltransferase
MSMSVLWHAAVETARISFPTVREARKGTLSHSVCDQRLRDWAWRLLEKAEVDLEVKGLHVLRSAPGPFVIVSNHESYYDIPCLFVALPLSIRMAAKKELFRTPIWGPALRASGFVEIDREDPEGAYQALHSAGKLMRERQISLYIAPEGTRSRDGSLGRFKKGAFEVALVSQLDVLPVVLRGTRQILHKGGRKVRSGCKVQVELLPLVDPTQFSSSHEMAEDVRGRIARTLAKK